MIVSELLSLWSFRVDAQALDALDERLKKLTATVKVVGTAAVGAAASMFGLAVTTGQTGAELGRAAARLGIGVEALQEYQFAARMAGQSNESFEGSLETLTKNLFDARRGLGSSREAFYLLSEVMGKDLLARGKSAESILNDVADGLTRIADPSRKLELAGQLFGGGGAAMISTMAKGSAGLKAMGAEASALGSVLTREATEAAEGFDQELTRTKATVMGLRNALGVSLFPMIEKVMGSLRRWILVNRQWLAVGMAKAFETLAGFIRHTVFIIERFASVANTAAIAFGGWNRVLKLVTTAMVTLLALRVATFFGVLVQGLWSAVTAFRALTIAEIASEAAGLAIPLAIGAAFIGLALILEDVVAYFQGRRSITGYILKDFAGLEGKITSWLAPLLGSLTELGKKLGKSIVSGFSGLSDADLGKFGTFLKNALTLAFDLGTIPFKLGMAIADGMIAGLSEGLRKKFPAIAGLLGISDPAAVGPPEEKHRAGDAPVAKGAFGDRLLNTVIGGGLSGDSLSSIALDAWRALSGAGAGKLAPDAPGRAVAAGAGFSGTQTVNVSAPITVNVPAGTSPEKVSVAVQRGVKDAHASTLREIHQTTKPTHGP